MKTIFAIFALCLVAVNAGTVDYEAKVNGVISELEHLAANVAETLQHQIEQTVLKPLHQVENAVESINARRVESEECFIAEEHHIVDVVDTMYHDMTTCGADAATTSAAIVSDVGAAVNQLVFSGYNVLTTYQRCRSISNSILQRSCYARLSIMAALYMNNARQSIATIRESINERIPAVINEANVCTHGAADTAIYELDNIHANMDHCIDIMI